VLEPATQTVTRSDAVAVQQAGRRQSPLNLSRPPRGVSAIGGILPMTFTATSASSPNAVGKAAAAALSTLPR
jgi:hypothetical protein